MLGFLVALVVVSELTVLAHFTGDRFSGNEDSAEVASLTGLPILAKVPRGEGIEVVEAYRVLRTNLMVLEGAGKPRTVAIVSANQAAGKTFTAVHLADSASALDEKVVLIDADLRKPTVHERARRAPCPRPLVGAPGRRPHHRAHQGARQRLPAGAAERRAGARRRRACSAPGRSATCSTRCVRSGS